MSCLYPKIAYQHLEDKTMLFLPPDYRQTVKDFDAPLAELAGMYSWYARNLNTLIHSRKLLIPCGQCIECRLQASREKATRIVLEASQYTDNWCVTLTYDDDHIPFGKKQFPTLVPEDIQKFNKDLRRYFDYHYNFKGIRFYCAGEYGEVNARPHYHMIYFNLPLPAEDVFLCKNEKSQTGEDLFVSEIMNKIWSKGRVRLNVLSWQYAAYCARYILKKQTGQNSEVYDELGIFPEFTRCSTQPGIGYNYLMDHLDEILDYGYITLKIGDKVEHAPIPQYFIRKIIDKEIDIEDLRENRRQAGEDGFYKKLYEHKGSDIFELLRTFENESNRKKAQLPRKL